MKTIKTKNAVPREAWEWFGLAGHYMCGDKCRFHLATKVGPWLVSTIGEYWPERDVREIHARAIDPGWLAAHQHISGDAFDRAYMERFGFKEIGAGRKYETLVFLAGKRCNAPDCVCGMPRVGSGVVDFLVASSPKEATAAHYRACRKWAARVPKRPTN